MSNSELIKEIQNKLKMYEQSLQMQPQFSTLKTVNEITNILILVFSLCLNKV